MFVVGYKTKLFVAVDVGATTVAGSAAVTFVKQHMNSNVNNKNFLMVY